MSDLYENYKPNFLTYNISHVCILSLNPGPAIALPHTAPYSSPTKPIYLYDKKILNHEQNLSKHEQYEQTFKHEQTVLNHGQILLHHSNHEQDVINHSNHGQNVLNLSNYCPNYSEKSHSKFLAIWHSNHFDRNGNHTVPVLDIPPLPLDINPSFELPFNNIQSSDDDSDALSINTIVSSSTSSFGSSRINPNLVHASPVLNYHVKSLIFELQNQNEMAYHLLSIVSDAHWIWTQRH